MERQASVDKLSTPAGSLYRIHVRTDGKLTASYVLERDAAMAKLIEYGHSPEVARDMIEQAAEPSPWTDQPELPEHWSEFG